VAERRVNPRRITQALDAGGHEGPAVDVACGGVEPMVDLWEAGRLVPTGEQLELLADLTGMTTEFFYLPDPEPLVGFMCVRSGRGRGCYPIDTRPSAPVVELHGQTALPF
jgi:hypothetical protein